MQDNTATTASTAAPGEDEFVKVEGGGISGLAGAISQGIDLDGPFASGMELLARMPGSKAVRDCMARRWFEYAVSRALEPGEACAVEPVQTRFRASGDLLDLVASIAESEAFRFQLVPQE